MHPLSARPWRKTVGAQPASPNLFDTYNCGSSRRFRPATRLIYMVAARASPPGVYMYQLQDLHVAASSYRLLSGWHSYEDKVSISLATYAVVYYSEPLPLLSKFMCVCFQSNTDLNRPT